MATKGKVYPCISLMVDDFEGEAFDKVKNLSDDELQRMADYIGEWLFDGDQWNMALESALEREEIAPSINKKG